MNVSRFNPTSNGPLHIGHIYNTLVIRAECDEFILRFDDNQRYWETRLGKSVVAQYASGQLNDLLWIGIEPTLVSYQSKMGDIVLAKKAKSPHWRAVYGHENPPIIVSNPRIDPWGPDFPVTAEKVILDHHQGVTVVIRGLELLQENALYLYLCGIFGYSQPRMIYIPRLMAQDGQEMTNISKTRGDWKIGDLRERGVRPEEILDLLRTSCLVDPHGGWQVSNVKNNPVLKEVEL